MARFKQQQVQVLQTMAAPQPDPEAPRKPARRAVVIDPDKPKKKSRKATEWEMMQRRKQVKRLRLRGKTFLEIAKELDVSMDTVQKDIAAIQKEYQEKADAFEEKEFIGQSMAALDEVGEHAMDEFYSADPGSKLRISALDMMRQSVNDKMKIAVDVGLVRRANQKVEVAHSVSLPWDANTKQSIINALIGSQLKPQYALPTPDEHHVPGNNIEVTALKPLTLQEAELVEPSGAVPPQAGDVQRAAEELLRRLVNSGVALADAKRTVSEDTGLPLSEVEAVVRALEPKP